MNSIENQENSKYPCKGIVYKILNDFDDMIYVGSTILTLDERFRYHKKPITYFTGHNKTMKI